MFQHIYIIIEACLLIIIIIIIMAQRIRYPNTGGFTWR